MYQPAELPCDLADMLATVRSWSTDERPHPSTAVERVDRLAGLRQLIDAAQAAFSHALADVSNHGDLHALFGASSTAAWLRSGVGFGLAAGEATQQARIARNNKGLLAEPVAALAHGHLVWDQVKVIEATVRTLADPSTAAEAVAFLTDVGRQSDTGMVRRAGQQIRHLVDPNQAARCADLDYARRRLHLSPLLDGMSHLDGLLDAEATAVLTEALAPLLTPAGVGDQRSTAQRRADGLVQLVQAGALAGGAVTGRAPTELTVVVDLDRLAPVGPPTSGPSSPGMSVTDVLNDAALPGRLPGHPTGSWLIPRGTLERLSCHPTLSIAVTGGPVPLQLGRTRRLFTPRQLRALALRDGGCRWPGCTRPPGHTEGHHRVPWLEGGPTDLDNGLLLCRWHHRLAHEGGWTIAVDDPLLGSHGRLWFQAPIVGAPPHPSDARGP